MLKVVPPEQMAEWSRQARDLKLGLNDQVAVADPALTEPFSLNYDWFHEERLPKYFKTYEIKEYLTKGYHLLSPQKSFDISTKPRTRKGSINADTEEGQRAYEPQEQMNKIQKGNSKESADEEFRPAITLAGQSNHSGQMVSAESATGSAQKIVFKNIGGTNFNFSSSKDIREIGAIQPLPEMSLANLAESPGHNNGSPDELGSPKKPRFTLAAMHQFKRRR